MLLITLTDDFTELSADDGLPSFRIKVDEKFSTEQAGAFEDFTKFMEDLAISQDTIRFWYQFVMKDIFCLCLPIHWYSIP